LLYLDSSALVKLVVTEAETSALRRYLRRRPDRVTSELSVAEVLRAALRRDAELIDAARRILDRVDRMALGSQLVERAGTLIPPGMRTLDALHIASALELGEELEAVVAYDRRLLDAAADHRLPTASPA
jgi:predicted nucleic acid-binding protein